MHNESGEQPDDLQQARARQSREIRASLSEFESLNEVGPGGIRAESIKSINVATQQRIDNQNIYLYQGQEQEERLVREAHQRSRIKEQRDHLPGRLKDFVGRTDELADLQAKIVQQQHQGGYVIVTGEAGQGKSSLITKLIVELGEEKVGAFHFVPVNAGHDHQVSLLRDLVKQLVYKHDLPRWYLSESYATLRENFREILDEIAKQGNQEILCLDGLDLLEMTASGEPDLSFLPRDLPAGITFVIGTRPNEVLNQVQRLVKSHAKCEVGQLGHEPFALLLHQRQITVSAELSQRLYQAMQGNALYLSVLIQVLDTQRDQSAEKIIAQVENNPDGIFTLAFARLKQRHDEWRNVIRPLLGTLLVAREPLTAQQLAHISTGENDLFREGMKHLGGFLTNTGQERYTLFHLKLYEYLRQDQKHPEWDYEFDAEEEADFHGKLAVWCGQGEDDSLWSDIPDRSFQDDYREYARRHYITHLYHAGMDEQLCAVLDSGAYERGKLRHDISARSVVQDLALGCQAAAREVATLDEGIARLIRLWKYTLLRSSLTSRADAHPLEAFEALLALDMSRVAIDLAELLTQPERKVAALTLLAQHLSQQPDRAAEGQQLFRRACELAATLANQQSRTAARMKLVMAHLHVGQLEQAEMLARSLEPSNKRLNALSDLAVALELAGQTEQAEALWQEIIATFSALPESEQRVSACLYLALAFLRVKRWQHVDEIIQSLEQAECKAEILGELALAFTRTGERAQAQTCWAQVRDLVRQASGSTQTQMQSKLVSALAQANVLDEAQDILRQMEDGKAQAYARKSIVLSLIAARQWEQSQAAIVEMQRRYKRDEIIGETFDEMLIEFAVAFVRAEQWEQAQSTIQRISHAHAQLRAKMRLVSELVAIGQPDQVQAMWNRARLMSTFQTSAELSSVLGTFISAFIQAGKSEQARRIVEDCSDEVAREELTCVLAIALAQTGQIAEAKTQTEDILVLRKKAAAQLAILQALLDAGEIDQAKEFALAIELEEDRWQALKLVAEAYAAEPQWEYAQSTANLISDLHVQPETLGRVAVVLAQHNRLEKARQIVESLNAPYAKAKAWCALAQVVEQTGNSSVAKNLRNRISNPDIKKKSFCQKLLFEGQGLWGAEQRVEAEKEAARIRDQIVRDEALQDVGFVYLQEGEWEYAQRVAMSIYDRRRQSTILRLLAMKSAEVGQWAHAFSAYELLQRGQRLVVAQAWGKFLAQTGERARTEKLLDYVKDNQERASFQAGIAHVMGENGRDQDLIRFTQRAWTQTETQEDCLREFVLARPLIEHYPDLGSALYDAFAWVDTFL